MADRFDVDPTPIQRNAFDIALELTNLYFQKNHNADIEKIDSIFARFYALAKVLQSTNSEIVRKYLSEDCKK